MIWEEIMQRARILIVDDEQANVRLLERLLEQAGYFHLVSTTDPRRVPDLIEADQPDLVLLDLHMPDLHGLDVLQEIHERLPPRAYLPVLVITADVTPEMKLRALLLGAKDFMTKPIDRLEVMLRIRILLETRFAFRELEEENRRLQVPTTAAS